MSKQSLIDLYIENINSLRAYAYSVVRNADDADDVVQELAVRIIKVGEAGTSIQFPKSYLYRCTRNLALDCVNRRREIPQEDEILAAHADPSPDKYREADTRLTLDKYLSELSPEMKQAFIRHYFEFEPIQSIADDLHIEMEALKARFYRIRKRIPKNVFLSCMLLHILHSVA